MQSHSHGLDEQPKGDLSNIKYCQKYPSQIEEVTICTKQVMIYDILDTFEQ